MDVRLTLTPGQPGTKRLVDEYGEQLICVRYRYDRARGMRYKTVELVVDAVPWNPVDKQAIVRVRVARLERDIQRAIRRAGGQWNQSAGVWEIVYREAERLGLLDRVVKEARVVYDETGGTGRGPQLSAPRPGIDQRNTGWKSRHSIQI